MFAKVFGMVRSLKGSDANLQCQGSESDLILSSPCFDPFQIDPALSCVLFAKVVFGIDVMCYICCETLIFNFISFIRNIFHYLIYLYLIYYYFNKYYIFYAYLDLNNLLSH